MADQNFMDLASKTASGITGTDYMMLVNNSEAYKALVNDVAEAILSKLTSKRFSGLETTAKNVIGALNELNSKSIFKNTMASDLNELLSLDTGVYIHRFVGATAENVPEKASGFVITHVHDTGNASQWIFFLKGNKYRRSKSSGSVGEWTRDNA